MLHAARSPRGLQAWPVARERGAPLDPAAPTVVPGPFSVIDIPALWERRTWWLCTLCPSPPCTPPLSIV